MAVGLLGLTAACSDADGSDANVNMFGDCADIVTVDGETWTALPLAANVSGRLVGAPIDAQRPQCSIEVAVRDGETQSSPTDAPDDVALRRIRGVPATQALVDPDHAPEVVYVPGREVTATAELPAAVRELVRHG
jgi:hypothetical protein